jgi:hypothetical protein
MKPLHAAALALASWYLLTPPLRGGGKPDAQAPISAWTVFRKFDSTAACQEWKYKLETRARKTGRYGPRPVFMCIASDDPRLRKNSVVLPGAANRAPSRTGGAGRNRRGVWR